MVFWRAVATVGGVGIVTCIVVANPWVLVSSMALLLVGVRGMQ